ncbi:MAG: hypothetical protein HFG48_00020, partial [Bacilli bacterium]|nr:hypothetical protein [Bacilli bacterium]
MAKKKLGIGEPLINKKFKTFEEAVAYAKRLKEFIRYNCKTKKRFCQAVIGVSNNNAVVIIDNAYEVSNSVGRPKKEKHRTEMKCYEEYGTETDWHIHLLLVAYPCCAMMSDIKNYVDKNWYKAEDIFDKSKYDWTKARVYKKQCNIGVAGYTFKQEEDIRFCDYNYTDLELVPKGYSLKKLYYEYLKVNKAKWNDESYYTRQGREKIEKRYNELLTYYFGISKE